MRPYCSGLLRAGLPGRNLNRTPGVLAIINPPHEPPDAKAYPYDPEKAKGLLAEAGWKPGPDGILAKDGQKLSLVMDSPSGRYIKDKEIAQAVQQDLQRIGVQVELKVLDWSVYAGDMLNKRNPDDIFLLGQGAPFNGQQELNYVHKDDSLNSTYWPNEEFHRLFEELKGTIDPARRQDLMNKAWAIAQDDPPWIYIWHQVDFYGVSKRLDGSPPRRAHPDHRGPAGRLLPRPPRRPHHASGRHPACPAADSDGDRPAGGPRARPPERHPDPGDHQLGHLPPP